MARPATTLVIVQGDTLGVGGFSMDSFQLPILCFQRMNSMSPCSTDGAKLPTIIQSGPCHNTRSETAQSYRGHEFKTEARQSPILTGTTICHAMHATTQTRPQKAKHNRQSCFA